MTTKIHSFKYEIIVNSLLSLFYTLCTEGVLFLLFYLFRLLIQNNDAVTQDTQENGSHPEFSNSIDMVKDRQGPRPHKNQDFFETYIAAILIIAIVIGVILFIVYFIILMKRFSKYLNEISAGMKEISAGNFEHEIPIRTNDEFGRIAKDINNMASQVDMFLKEERKNEKVKNDLITGVAHDLRTPLTSIIGYLYLASDTQKRKPEEMKHYVEIAYNKSKRLEHLIEELFRYTKYSTNQVQFHLEKIDFVKFMEQMGEEFYPSLEDCGLRYEFYSEADSALIYADGNALARAIANLYSNAIKYGKDGKVIKINIKTDEQNVYLSMLNYGEVIPEEGLKHIFERFYRVENSRSEETGGSGIGLAIAKKVIELHGGTIDAKSSMEGTVFLVSLNLVQD